MPQEITVVQCYKCNRFQSKIVTLSKKWSCVVCNEKQSLKKTFGTGTGKECRSIVQNLNEQLLKRAEDEEQSIEDLLNEEEENAYDSMTESSVEEQMKEDSVRSITNTAQFMSVPVKKNSKWTKYLECDQENNS